MYIQRHPGSPLEPFSPAWTLGDCRHEETRKERPNRGEHLNERVATCQLVGLVIARTHVHDRREMARFEQANAAKEFVRQPLL